jgi:hypothetical protein
MLFVFPSVTDETFSVAIDGVVIVSIIILLFETLAVSIGTFVIEGVFTIALVFSVEFVLNTFDITSI